ncbi:tRNA (adenosine(37)-N6)-threonylcarbamoyltransferase complex ATPase subunit type 1 TsaE [Leptospira sp. 2 VSF19]|uniref:tRNA threonylcarbamoyladenosine biosynthesis protein TsaE n=1 Tax=Leptospira soteropolitanensis TaxID=2950025 RepID=A0AAW5VJQ2_9LEPT|nr:tRNA (adenosine(37)-N6)-threonylcarbamoyltransferase complex ATPase subunit type 1 TsaE [Leptospira soteropolitanensis]MCW7491572.1 tRNA (adenosine(37)-N6)-threonylcarbamoyltransferase complex ATPase subunit type 1 TsaE [Leptospira soteropolitanensis]MCW7499156.1 tRNA (adenosine(37)-N6)-threonylcarbamoyltransferase complex ATPase subunit type 1 TsaE [Leptospira soteropolitanensis]MCW7521252.1 tRNA (adenosine(37)-N6)-threonylcarbamoyltransferase complex ATPase subunit type 1 TsaE [Leptospira s
MKANFLSLRESELNPVFLSLDQLVDQFIKKNKFPVILISGEMGAGKTTFIREWFSHYDTNSSINSPTFSLYNIYDSPNFRLYHFDLYRIRVLEELEDLGFEEIWGKEGVSAIEWWQIAEPNLPKTNRIYLSIETDSIEVRSYTLQWKEEELQ